MHNYSHRVQVCGVHAYINGRLAMLLMLLYRRFGHQPRYLTYLRGDVEWRAVLGIGDMRLVG